MKTTAILVAVAMVLMTMAPVATANKGSPDGNISRTFLTWGSIDWKPHSSVPADEVGGAGWYHPDNRDGLCLFRLFGVSISAGFYYEGIPKPRVTFDGVNEHLAEFGDVGVFVDCPPPLADATTPNPQFLGTSAGNVYLGGQISQSHLLCTKTFSLCQQTAQRWFLYDCNGYDGTGSGKKNANQVTFREGDILDLGIGLGIGSSGVWSGCTRDGPGSHNMAPDPGVKAYDATPYLSSLLAYSGSLPDVHVDQLRLNDPGHPKYPNQTGPMATSYVVSCVEVTYNKFPEGTTVTDRTHDYFLVLGENDQDNWLPALVYHELEPTETPGKKYAPGHDSIAEQGLYDLSGQNGCPSEMNVVDKQLCPHASYRHGGSNTCTVGDTNKKPKGNALIDLT